MEITVDVYRKERELVFNQHQCVVRYCSVIMNIAETLFI